MKKSLMYGTATTMLIAMALVPVDEEKAFAVPVGWEDPEVLLQPIQSAYGPPVEDRTKPEFYEITEETSKLSYLALDIAMGAALTAAGVDLAYRMSRHSDSESRQEPDEPDATQDNSTASSVDSGDGTNE